MKTLQIEIGRRLAFIRTQIISGGVKLSTRQFAKLLGSTGDRIQNYESGKSQIPNELLVELYKRGISPQYILTGDGSVYVDNEAGRALRGQADEKNSAEDDARPPAVDLSKYSYDELVTLLNVAAGDIAKRRKEKGE